MCGLEDISRLLFIFQSNAVKMSLLSLLCRKCQRNARILLIHPLTTKQFLVNFQSRLLNKKLIFVLTEDIFKARLIVGCVEIKKKS